MDAREPDALWYLYHAAPPGVCVGELLRLRLRHKPLGDDPVGGPKIAEVRHIPTCPDAVERIMDAITELDAITGASVYILPAMMRPDLPEGPRRRRGRPRRGATRD